MHEERDVSRRRLRTTRNRSGSPNTTSLGYRLSHICVCVCVCVCIERYMNI